MPSTPARAEPVESTAAAAAPAPSTTPPQPREILRAPVADDRIFPFTGSVSVVADPAATGVPPVGGFFAGDCDLAADTTQYVAVEVTFDNTSAAVAVLAAGVELRSADGPADDVALFVASGSGNARYCQDGDRTPAADHFATSGSAGGGQGTVHLYVTRQMASAGDSGAGAFAGLVLAFSALENTADSVPGPWAAGHWSVTDSTVGGPCPDDATALCAPLG